MGRRGVTREAVENAHDSLVAAGLVPSVRTVRERLGDTGSLTTIAEHLRAIHAERQEGPGPAVPDAIARKLLDGASSFWRDLTEAADQIVADVRQSAASEVAAALAERDDAREQAARARRWSASSPRRERSSLVGKRGGVRRASRSTPESMRSRTSSGKRARRTSESGTS